VSIFINPGSGPVSGATYEDAARAMDQFIDDLELDGISWAPGPSGSDDGRYNFLLLPSNVRVEMPGIPLDQVRYQGVDDQNIWDFPRLYVDGSSWVWCYAISAAARTIRGDDE
jgi:hypothetical protein